MVALGVFNTALAYYVYFRLVHDEGPDLREPQQLYRAADRHHRRGGRAGGADCARGLGGTGARPRRRRPDRPLARKSQRLSGSSGEDSRQRQLRRRRIAPQAAARRLVVVGRKHHRGGADEAAERRHEADIEQEDAGRPDAAVVHQRPEARKDRRPGTPSRRAPRQARRGPSGRSCSGRAGRAACSRARPVRPDSPARRALCSQAAIGTSILPARTPTRSTSEPARPFRVGPSRAAKARGGQRRLFSASASRRVAEPGCSGFGWLSCGAQAAEPHDVEGRAQSAVRIGEALGIESAAARRATSRRRGLRLRASTARSWPPSRADRQEARTCRRSERSRGRGRRPAAPSPPAAQDRQARARRRTGATRGDAPPRISLSAIVRLWRSSVSVSPPIIAAIEEAVGLQRAPHLNQRARQIVHGLQSEQRDGEVEAAIRRGQALEVADRRQKIAGPPGSLRSGRSG